MSELSFESVLIQVKATLQSHKIRLWEPPYYLDTAANETEMINLASNFSEVLNIKFEYCLAALNELQSHALDKLRSNEELKNDGLATLKIKLSSKRLSGSKLFDVKVKLVENAEKLKTIIADEVQGVESRRLKLISNGKVLENERSLQDQQMKNFQQVLALEIELDKEQASAESQPYDRIQKIRNDAEALLKNQNSDYFNLENQNGETVHLPEHERTSLMMALLLYEKGRAQLKNENYNEALILFLEADNEIQNCQSTIIKSIDNIALLNIDIVWCYLQLKSFTQLPDAERRLQLCEESFKRTYGQNFERVKMIKNTEMSEKCLIVRLKLLKGILYFHQNRRMECSTYLTLAEQEIAELKVDEEKLSMLEEMGYQKSEAIIALRNTYSASIEAAVNFILDRRTKLKEARKDGKKERQVAKFLEIIGLSANPRDVCKLVDMGFEKQLAAFALQKANNDLNGAITLLETQHDLLKSEIINFIKPNPDLVDRLRCFGFDEKLVIAVLKSHLNDFDTALESLLQMKDNENFQIPFDLQNIMNNNENTSKEDVSSSSSLAKSTTDINSPSTSSKKPRISPEEEKAIFDDLRNDLDHLDDDDEYLTFTLDRESELLNQYKRALGM